MLATVLDLPHPRALHRRVPLLAGGLVLAGTGIACMVRARLGLGPWDVLHQAIARHVGLPMGRVVILTGLLVLVAWVPLRQRPGVGTVANAVTIGLVIDAVLGALAPARGAFQQWAFLAVGLVLLGAGTGAYLTAGLGAGPRDGLMVGLAARGHSVRSVRTLIEVSALTVGAALGGPVGAGTLVVALATGPVVQRFLEVLAPFGEPSTTASATASATASTKASTAAGFPSGAA